jgi:hypothetical protein
MWELGADNTPKSHPRVVHHLLRTYGILALAYRPSTGALLSAGGLRLFSTDMETGSSAFANTVCPLPITYLIIAGTSCQYCAQSSQ